jgi:hypothetical protein
LSVAFAIDERTLLTYTFIAPKHTFDDGNIGSESELFAQESDSTEDSEYSSESDEPSPPIEPLRTISDSNYDHLMAIHQVDLGFLHSSRQI